MEQLTIDVLLEQYLTSHKFSDGISADFIYNSFSNSFGHEAFELDTVEDILEQISCFRNLRLG